MNNKAIKRILPFMIIIFLLSCSNQQKGEKETKAESKQEKEQALSMKKVEADEGSDVIAEKGESGAITVNLSGENAEQEKKSSSEISVLFNKGTTAYNNDDFEAGVDYFLQIIGIEPDNRKAYYNLGVGYKKLGRPHDALTALNNAIAIMPGDSVSLQMRGRIYFTLGKYDLCLKDYELVLQMKPDDPISWYNRGTAKGPLKDYMGAKNDFDKAIEMKPDYADAYFNRGLANYHMGRLHEACYDWNKAHGLGHYESEKAIRSYCEGEN